MIVKQNQAPLGESPPSATGRSTQVLNAVLKAFASGGVLPILLVAMVVVFGVLEPRFLSSDNLINIVRQSTFLTLVAMGQMLVLLTAGFDLSVGAIVALVSVLTASTMATSGESGSWFVVAAAIVVGILAGALCGLFNGIGVAYLKVSPFIVTLGTSSVFAGAALLITGGAPIVGLSSKFTSTLGSDRFLGIPAVVYLTILVVVLVGFVIGRTRFGRYVYAVGGNEIAARLSGVRVSRTLLSVYVASGVLAAGAGILLTARVSAGEPNLGGALVLQSITAAVLGGVSLRGGEGRLAGVVLGALFIGMLSNGMNLIRVSSYYQMIALGSLLIFAVVVDRLRARVRQTL